MGNLHIIWITVFLDGLLILYWMLYKNRHKAELKITGKWNYIYFGAICLVLLGIAAALCILYPENSLLFNVKHMVLIGLLSVAAWVDYQSYKVPNSLILIGLGAWIIISLTELIFVGTAVKWMILSEIIASAGLLTATMLCRLCIKNSIGYGDIKLLIMLGLFLGINSTINAVFLSLIGTFIFSVLALITKKKNKKDVIPFAPAVFAGTTAAICLTGI